MAVPIPIRKEADANPKPTVKAQPKHVACTEKAIAALPADSGWWKCTGAGVPAGLYVICQKTTKSFVLQRKIDGKPVKEGLGQLAAKEAKAEAMRRWNNLKPALTQREALTLAAAVASYIEHRVMMGKMAASTKALAEYNLEHYLDKWKGRPIKAVAADRAGLAAFHQRITIQHGRAKCNQIVRLLAAVYRWTKDRTNETDWVEWPRKVAEIHSIKARDWAYIDAELAAWWHSTKRLKDGTTVELGVSTLGRIKRMWWLTALFTGARKGSIEALRWSDVDLEKKTIHFRVTKGDRPYVVPMADKLAELLETYRKRDDVPPTSEGWLFPSTKITERHMIDVKNPVEGVGPAHRLRHTFRTRLVGVGATPDVAKLLLGHSLSGSVSTGYITAAATIESLRPFANAVATRYCQILPAIG